MYAGGEDSKQNENDIDNEINTYIDDCDFMDCEINPNDGSVDYCYPNEDGCRTLGDMTDPDGWIPYDGYAQLCSTGGSEEDILAILDANCGHCSGTDSDTPAIFDGNGICSAECVFCAYVYAGDEFSVHNENDIDNEIDTYIDDCDFMDCEINFEDDSVDYCYPNEDGCQTLSDMTDPDGWIPPDEYAYICGDYQHQGPGDEFNG